jgi:hypothetical protein
MMALAIDGLDDWKWADRQTGRSALTYGIEYIIIYAYGIWPIVSGHTGLRRGQRNNRNSQAASLPLAYSGANITYRKSHVP